jgi:transcription initiation factor TFIIB
MNEIGNCPECGNTNLLIDNDVGELVCVRCGYVVSSTLIDEGPEWRAFDLEEKETNPEWGRHLH